MLSKNVGVMEQGLVRFGSLFLKCHLDATKQFAQYECGGSVELALGRAGAAASSHVWQPC